jgi:succinylarginine dihydrolase
VWIWGGTAIGLVRLTNFINGLSFGIDCSKSGRNEESSSRGALNSGLTSADSGLQLNLEIALSGVSAKVKPPNRFLVRPKVR